MLFYASKALPLFLYPLGLSMALLAIACMLRKRPGACRILPFAALAILAIFSSGAVSDALMRSLESRTPVRALDSLPVEQAIVVLGGYLHSPTVQRRGAELNEAADRLLYAMRLYRAGKAPLVLLTGGNISFYGKNETSEALAARGLLGEWGLPAGSILVEDQSRNTNENAAYSRRILDGKGIRRILLVTSAFHMPRALAVFRKNGFDAVAVPVDFQTGWGEPDRLFRYLPDPQNLSASTVAIKEWLGLGLYRLRGWA